MSKNEIATFGAGCFWGVEERFRQTPGVVSTSAGYMGGEKENPTYEEVCKDTTGHAEVVQMEYDSQQITYDELLNIFWHSHDPTQLNRQGPDTGTQYRSVIFYHNQKQQEQAIASKEAVEQSGKYTEPVVTEIVAAGTFHKAEEYHQQYLAKRGKNVCH